MKDLGLALGMATITVLPFALLGGLAVGAFHLVKKFKEKPDRIARIGSELGVEAEWPNLEDFNELYDYN